MDEFAPPLLFAWIRRPIELYFHLSESGATAEIGAVRLLDPQLHQLVRNGDFTEGTARWFFTDDDHIVWRMKDQFLMLLFEQGVLGVASYVLLSAAAFLGLWRAVRAGILAAAPIAAAIATYFSAGLFDYLLEAPRLATLFYLLCFAGLAIPAASDRRPPEPGVST